MIASSAVDVERSHMGSRRPPETSRRNPLITPMSGSYSSRPFTGSGCSAITARSSW
jgi:hypothetical protein